MESLAAYDVGRRLGNGTFGTVYLATRKKGGDVACVKKLEFCPGKPPVDESPVEREVKAIFSVQYPNVVKVLGWGREAARDGDEDGYRPWILLEYCSQGSLKGFIDRAKKAGSARLDVEEEQVVRWVKDVLSALTKLHSSGIMHRDLKPANVVVHASGVAKVCDFGVAASSKDTHRTHAGTIPYMAPQIVYETRDRYKADADMYSVGVMVLEMFTLLRIPAAQAQGGDRDTDINKLLYIWYLEHADDTYIAEKKERDLHDDVRATLGRRVSHRWSEAVSKLVVGCLRYSRDVRLTSERAVRLLGPCSSGESSAAVASVRDSADGGTGGTEAESSRVSSLPAFAASAATPSASSARPPEPAVQRPPQASWHALPGAVPTHVSPGAPVAAAAIHGSLPAFGSDVGRDGGRGVRHSPAVGRADPSRAPGRTAHSAAAGWGAPFDAAPSSPPSYETARLTGGMGPASTPTHVWGGTSAFAAERAASADGLRGSEEVTLRRRGPHEATGLFFDGASLVLAWVADNSPAYRCDARKYVGWRLSHIEGKAVEWAMDVRGAIGDKTSVLRFVPPTQAGRHDHEEHPPSFMTGLGQQSHLSAATEASVGIVANSRDASESTGATAVVSRKAKPGKGDYDYAPLAPSDTRSEDDLLPSLAEACCKAINCYLKLTGALVLLSFIVALIYALANRQ